MNLTADLIVQNATLWSGTALRGADSLAIAEGRILAAGTTAELRPLRGSSTRVLDARRATVTPGMTDAHLHLVAWARARTELDLRGCASAAEVCGRLSRDLGGRAGEGAVIGRGWDSNGWADAPHRRALDSFAPDRPVLLHSHDFHALWVNSAALRAAGVGAASADPPGGILERDPSGEPTGVVREHAVRLFAGLDSAARPSLETLRAASARLLALGVTAVHDFEGAEAQRCLRALALGVHPRVRVLMHLPHAGLDAALALGLESGVGDDRFRIGAVKLFADGTLGSRTAAMLAPCDDGTGSGMELIDPDSLRETVRKALEGGVAVAVHAIGDRACRSVLDAFEAAGERLREAALPSRIEHLQLVDPADLPRLARLGIAASMQPVHCTSDRDVAERAWGRRCAGAYAWRAVLESGALLAFGSDAPVESPSVAAGLHAAVTREQPGRPGAFVPEQRITLDQALVAYTEAPARLAGEWPRRGALRVGAAADVVIWNADLHRLDPDELSAAYPVATVLDGEVVHGIESFAEPGTEAAAGGAARVGGKR